MDLVDGTSCSLHSVQLAILILFITLDRPPVIPSLRQLHLLIVPITFDLVTIQATLSNIILTMGQGIIYSVQCGGIISKDRNLD
ncbi:MAG: hypothetical protein EZS28_023983 [Streblomastix strix]|uniref:Uncharacterized protein n=1 Tax=Streblomastix strix TaxID=222440 RepID=A0A5J4VDC4_9EUKA|nr:MAG: hypothetical protein EZS28_023983 [Streblomastix strix]